jgi:hypothetical protein
MRVRSRFGRRGRSDITFRRFARRFGLFATEVPHLKATARLPGGRLHEPVLS